MHKGVRRKKRMCPVLNVKRVNLVPPHLVLTRVAHVGTRFFPLPFHVWRARVRGPLPGEEYRCLALPRSSRSGPNNAMTFSEMTLLFFVRGDTRKGEASLDPSHLLTFSHIKGFPFLTVTFSHLKRIFTGH